MSIATLAPAAIRPVIVDCATEAEWLAHRGTYLGGSDMAAILGVSRFRGPGDVYAAKVDEASDTDVDESEDIRWGRRMEPLILAALAEDHGLVVTPNGRRLYRHPTQPWAACTPDGWADDGAGVEAKNTSAWLRYSWPETHGELVEVTPDCGITLPNDPYVQVQWSMGVTGAAAWYIAVLIGGNRLRAFRVHRDEVDLAVLREAAERFWREHVEPRVPPEPLADEPDPDRWLRKLYPRAADVEPVTLDDRLRLHAEAFTEARETRDLAGAACDYHAAKLKRALGEAPEGVVGGYRVRWSGVKGRTFVDVDALKAAHPKLVKEFTRVGEPTRRFDVKALKED